MADSKWSLPGWLTVLFDVFASIIGAVWGAKIAEKEHEKHEEQKPWSRVGDLLEKELKLDRADLEEEFLRCGDNVKELRELLVEMNAAGSKGITVKYTFAVDGGQKTVERTYYEHPTAKLLLEIPKKNRKWVYEKLNRVLKEEGRPEFFGLMEILRNDGHVQFLGWLGGVISGAGKEVIDYVGPKLSAAGKAITSMPVRIAALICLAALAIGAVVVILGPIPILVLGIVKGLGWLVSLVGIFWAFATLILILIGTPLGILVESLIELASPTSVSTAPGSRLNPLNWIPKILGILWGGGQRWVSAVKGILLAELAFVLLVSILPIHNNLKALPVMLVAAAVLGLVGGTTQRGRKLVSALATFLLVFFTISLFLPKSYGELDGVRGKADEKVAKVLRGEYQFSAPTPPPPAPQPATAPAPQTTTLEVAEPPRCPGAMDVMTYEGFTARTTLHKGCTTGAVIIPSGLTWHAEDPQDREFLVKFAGENVWVPAAMKVNGVEPVVDLRGRGKTVLRNTDGRNESVRAFKLLGSEENQEVELTVQKTATLLIDP